MRKLALKRLKKSDLTFFKSLYSPNEGSKQKGFNLDAKILGDKFFPDLKNLLSPLPKKSTHVDLTIFGPGHSEAYTLSRKVKIDAKNFRLNGELIHDPEDHPGRFNDLGTDDFAIFEFDGSKLPETVNIVLIARSNTEDHHLHHECQTLLSNPTDSMCILTENALLNIIKAAAPSSGHPIRGWIDAELRERIAEGDSNAISEVLNRSSSRGMSIADLKAAKLAAARTGELGEELMDLFLKTKKDPIVQMHTWESQSNAISPYDFIGYDESGSVRHLDAKSTSSKFNTPLHLSTAEVSHAIHSEHPYDIYRLYEVTDQGAKLRIARDIKQSLLKLESALGALPSGVTVDSMSFNPGFFNFDPQEFFVDNNADFSDV